MRVTLLGHASVLVEARRRDMPMDRVLADPSRRGRCVVPERTIDADRLPR